MGTGINKRDGFGEHAYGIEDLYGGKWFLIGHSIKVQFPLNDERVSCNVRSLETAPATP